ncbi:MAG: lipopolysaccharide heptosyltransferase II [Candidatus Zixiibacteriota bacterium]
MEHKRILIIQTAFLGDVILSTPLIKALRGLFPHSFISFLLIPETKKLLENNPHLNEILVYDKRNNRGIRGFLHIKSKIKERKFDLAVIPHRSLRSALLAYLSGIPERVGFDQSAGSFLLTQKVAYRQNTHEVDRNLSLLSSFNLELKDKSPQLFPTEEDFSYARKLLQDSGIQEQDRIVGIAPGSVWATKRWLPERFAEVSDFLLKQSGAKVIFLGSEDDRKLCLRIAGMMKGKPLVLAGRTDVMQSAAVISFCKVILSNDSAPVHIASAMKRPVVAIFGSTIPEFGFAPYGVHHTITQRKLYCRPCGIHGRRKCPEKHFRCMREILAAEVFQAVALHLQ